ncbi:MAG: site-specific DNA-methyltransferase [Anaeromyxobacter sp.]|nr:site-specific DNA-methyltransferase [Anaeromyxobacter sp.]
MEAELSEAAKLELRWIGKDERPRLEPRVLIEDVQRSYVPTAKSAGGIAENRLLHCDNLLALKALEQEFTNRIKCVVIDPPYNTGRAFSHYDDGLEHSIWLGLMRDRLEMLWRLLSPDGSLWMSLDDTEVHYAKVLCDEVFGRSNFVANVIWQKKSSAQPNDPLISATHDQILVYAKDKAALRFNKLPRTAAHDSIYKHSDKHDGINPDGTWYGRGPWFPGDATATLQSGARGEAFARSGTDPNIYPITTPAGREVWPPETAAWRFSKKRLAELISDNRITFGESGDNRPCIKRFLAEMKERGITPMTVWHYREVGENRVATAESKKVNAKNPFPNPKPERLIHRILTIATGPGDWVLDSFAGSGTTGAVAHKMKRRWIMVELGDQCDTHIVPRLKGVIEGTDSIGVTKDAEWSGGGGFRYYRLAPSLVEKDKWGQLVISPKYDPAVLAQALCKLEGFAYDPSAEHYWAQGRSTERDFIYVTTQALTSAQLEALSEEVGPKRSLLVCCAAFSLPEGSGLSNLTLKKIPKAVLSKCEWGRDDYSLNIRVDTAAATNSADDEEPAEEQISDETEENFEEDLEEPVEVTVAAVRKKSNKKASQGQLDLPSEAPRVSKESKRRPKKGGRR